MALAGYLVLNNVRAAYVEINTGVLICTPRLRKTAPPTTQRAHLPPSCSAAATSDDCTDASRLSSASTDSTATSMSSSDSSSDEARALPLLARCRMLTKRSSALYRHKTASEYDNDGDDSSSDSLDDDEPVPEDEPAASSAHGCARVVQLSGHVVEIIERDDATAQYPFSFQVNTYTPAKRDAAGNKIGSSELVDSLVLAAVDAKAKALWVKRIRHWNRFGWRETEFVHADDNDFFALQARMLADDTGSYASQRAADKRSDGASRPARRRFYRAPTSGLDLLVPPS